MKNRPWAMHWMNHFHNDPEFGHMRFKKLDRRYPPMDIDRNLVDEVGEVEFNNIEADRLPLIVGTQFGLHPALTQEFLYGERFLAILGKSLLSGCVAGLSIHSITPGCSITLLMNSPRVKYFKNVEFI